MLRTSIKWTLRRFTMHIERHDSFLIRRSRFIDSRRVIITWCIFFELFLILRSISRSPFLLSFIHFHHYIFFLAEDLGNRFISLRGMTWFHGNLVFTSLLTFHFIFYLHGWLSFSETHLIFPMAVLHIVLDWDYLRIFLNSDHFSRSYEFYWNGIKASSIRQHFRRNLSSIL